MRVYAIKKAYHTHPSQSVPRVHRHVIMTIQTVKKYTTHGVKTKLLIHVLVVTIVLMTQMKIVPKWGKIITAQIHL